jgi:exodeoxyribonuclease VII large subunit
LPSPEDLIALPRQRLDHAAARLTLQTLHTRIARERQQVALLGQRSCQCLRHNAERGRSRYESLAQRLTAARAAYASARRNQIARERDRLIACHKRAVLAMTALVERRFARLERAESLLVAVSYRGVLARGFALVRDAKGAPLRTATAVSPGLALDIEFADGRVRATAGEARMRPPPTRRRPRGGGEGQGNLFEP